MITLNAQNRFNNHTVTGATELECIKAMGDLMDLAFSHRKVWSSYNKIFTSVRRFHNWMTKANWTVTWS